MPDHELKVLSPDDVWVMAKAVAHRIINNSSIPLTVQIFGVPRGGVPVAYAVARAIEKLLPAHAVLVVDHVSQANVIVDDIIDSGTTKARLTSKYPVPFYALVDKTVGAPDPAWYVFPWEKKDESTTETFEDNVLRMLQAIGEDVTREGLKDTPSRVVRAWREWFRGYNEDPAKLFKAFTDGADKQQGNEMVLVSNIPVYSHCEHHMAPIFGHAHVAYIPNGKIIGLSKVARVLRCYTRRLQVQERLTNQIADAFVENLTPLGVGVIIKARHFCMESRGVNISGTITTTSALRGNLLMNPDARNEFLTLVGQAERK